MKRRKRSSPLPLLIALVAAVVLVLVLVPGKEPAPEAAEDTIHTEPTQTEAPTEDPYAFAHTPQDKLVVFARLNGLSMTEDWPEDILELLFTNPDAEEFALNYPLLKGTSQEADLSDLVGTGKVPQLYQWDARWGYSR